MYYSFCLPFHALTRCTSCSCSNNFEFFSEFCHCFLLIKSVIICILLDFMSLCGTEKYSNSDDWCKNWYIYIWERERFQQPGWIWGRSAPLTHLFQTEDMLLYFICFYFSVTEEIQWIKQSLILISLSWIIIIIIITAFI